MEVKKISFHYPRGQPVIENFSYALMPRRRVGLFGPNGSGKTTLLKLFGGLLAPSKGELYLHGRNIQEIKIQNRAQHIAWVTQPRPIDFPMKAQEVVRLGRACQNRRWLAPFSLEDDHAVREAMEQTCCWPLRDLDYSTLSTGQRQLVQLARGFAQGSSVLLLDEVFSSLDLGFRERTMECLKRWVFSDNRSALLVSHDLNFLLEHVEEIIFWNAPQAVFVGTPQDLVTQLQKLDLLFEGCHIRKFQHPLTLKDQLLFGLKP